MYMYDWAHSLVTWKYHNIVNQLYPHYKMFLVLKMKLQKFNQEKNKNHDHSPNFIYNAIC